MGSVRALPKQFQWLIYFGTQQVSDVVQVWEEFWSGNRSSLMKESSVKSWLLPMAAIPPPLHCLPQLSTGATLGCPCLSENLAAASCIEVMNLVTLLKLLSTTFPKGKKPLSVFRAGSSEPGIWQRKKSVDCKNYPSCCPYDRKTPDTQKEEIFNKKPSLQQWSDSKQCYLAIKLDYPVGSAVARCSTSSLLRMREELCMSCVGSSSVVTAITM